MKEKKKNPKNPLCPITKNIKEELRASREKDHGLEWMPLRTLAWHLYDDARISINLTRGDSLRRFIVLLIWNATLTATVIFLLLKAYSVI